MHLPWRSLGLLAGLLIIAPVKPGVLGAQQPVTITGRVTNEAGAPLSLASVYVVALIVDALAPNFGSQKNFLQALKLVAFSMTAAWLAGIFSLLPALSILGLLGLYSLYVLFLGLPILMKTPEDKVIPYFVVILIAAVVVNVVIGALAALTIPGTLRGF